tara:strand:+ start:201 stop:611 length:411 start_codon:yes stop_codon:yes gene_type:complete
MAYGSVLTDVVQSSVTGTPPVFKDGSSNETGQLCRAWGFFKFVASGSSPTKNASFNISSFTRTSNGDFTINFTNAMADTNYGVVVGFNYSSGFDSISGQVYPPDTTTGSFRFREGYTVSGGTLSAYDYGFTVAVFR